MPVDVEKFFCPIFWSSGVFWFNGVCSKTCAFEVTHFWVNVFRADEFLARFVSRLEVKVGKIGRKQMIRIVCPLIAVQLTLLL